MESSPQKKSSSDFWTSYYVITAVLWVIVIAMCTDNRRRPAPPTSRGGASAEETAAFTAALAEHGCDPNIVTIEKLIGVWWVLVKDGGAATASSVFGRNYRVVTQQLETLGLDSVPGSAVFTECS